MNPEDFRTSESIIIHSEPDKVFNTVTDIARTGEWSPVVETCWWEETTPDGDPQVGDVFYGRNVTATRVWETRCTVTGWDRPNHFTWIVGDGVVNWGFHIDAHDEGTKLTETWEVTDFGFEFFRNKYGENAEAELDDRRKAALEGIPETLKRIKQIIETQ